MFSFLHSALMKCPHQESNLGCCGHNATSYDGREGGFVGLLLCELSALQWPTSYPLDHRCFCCKQSKNIGVLASRMTTAASASSQSTLKQVLANKGFAMSAQIQLCSNVSSLQAWTHWGLNPRPSACRVSVIPLHHVPPADK